MTKNTPDHVCPPRLRVVCFSCGCKLCSNCATRPYKVIPGSWGRKRHICYSCCNKKTHIHTGDCSCKSCEVRNLPPYYENDKARSRKSVVENVDSEAEDIESEMEEMD